MELILAEAAEARLRGVRQLKNSVIGNTRRKEQLVKEGVVEAMAHVLRVDSDDAIRLEAAVLLGSLAHGSSGAIERCVERQMII